MCNSLDVRRFVEAINKSYNELISLDQHVCDKWNSLPICTVGPQKVDAFGQLQLLRNHRNVYYWIIAPRASELIKPFKSKYNFKSFVLLLTGDKRRDIIPEALSGAHISFREVKNYVACAYKERQR